MKFEKEIENSDLVIIWQYDSHTNRTYYDSALTIEDAYDLIENFLKDTFQLTKEEVIEEFERDNSDYIDLYNPDKITEKQVYWDGPEFGPGEYFFRLWKTNTHKVVKK